MEYRNISLKDRNSFGIEASCDRLVDFVDAEDLRQVVSSGLLSEMPWSVLSGGNNILFTGDYRGVLLHPVGREISVLSDDGTQVRVRAQAGVEWDDFVAWCVERGLWGVENLSYIPGYVGAAPVQNIGAYGAEVKDVIESVETFSVETLKTLTLAAAHCGFGYRDSVFKGTLRGRVVITAVHFVLSRTPAPRLGYGDLQAKVESMGGPSLTVIREAVVAIRRSKLPDPKELGNAGSFFKNPVVPDSVAQALKKQFPDMPSYPGTVPGTTKLAAGWLIDQCGWRGRREGCVGVHERQALVLVNYGGATGQEVLELAARIRQDVQARFGVEIDMEVNVL